MPTICLVGGSKGLIEARLRLIVKLADFRTQIRDYGL